MANRRVRKSGHNILHPRRLAVFLACWIGLALLIAWRAYAASPGRIINATISALNSQNASALVGLASRKERESLNLTESTVRAFLVETLWRGGDRKPTVQVRRRRPYFDNILAYDVEVAGIAAKSPSRQAEVLVYHDGSGPWRLNLSQLLIQLPKVSTEVTIDEVQDWRAIARRSGIVGVAYADGTTSYLDGSTEPAIHLTHK